MKIITVLSALVFLNLSLFAGMVNANELPASKEVVALEKELIGLLEA